MAAGLGFKTFTSGEVLTAANVNGYLMQGINVFASTAARDAAITSPQEGQFAFTKDTNGLWYYDGAAWVASGATGDIEGVTAGVGISGGGTSGTVTVTNSMATAIDAKGDLIGGTGADTFSRLAVGANNTVLTADSAEATGLKWATPAAGGMTLLSTTTMSGTTTSITSIDQTYTNLYFVIQGFNPGGSNQIFSLRFNSNTSSEYYWANGSSQISSSDTKIDMCAGNTLNANQNQTNNIYVVEIPRYASSQRHFFNAKGVFIANASNTDRYTRDIYGVYNNTTAISSVQLITSPVAWNEGVVYMYGVK
jgi:hypothetical protein